MRGINEAVDESFVDGFDRGVTWDLVAISFADFERFRLDSVVLIGEVEQVREFLFERRRLS